MKLLRFPLIRLLIALLILGVVAFTLVAVLTWIIGPARILQQDLTELVVQSVATAIGALVAYGITERKITKCSLKSMGFATNDAVGEIGLGFAIGAGLIGLVVAVLRLFGWYRVVSVGGSSALLLLLALGLFFLVAVFEEIVFRGLIFRLTEEWLGTWAALVISALLFGVIHLANPNASVQAAIAITIEAGILLGAAYLLTRRLWLAIGIHWAWNFTLGCVFGLPVSGLNLPTVIVSRVTGPDPWTGGDFGPEAGIAALLICTAAGFVLLRRAHEKKRFLPPGTWRQRLAPAAAEYVAMVPQTVPQDEAPADAASSSPR